MSSDSRMTRSKGPAEELSLPPTRMRKDVSTANEGEENAQGQVQANVQSQQRTVDMPSPFARPGSRAGTCTTPASEGGMLPKASNPFAWPNSRAGFAPPEPTSPQSSVLYMSDNQLQEDVNMSVSWDLVDTDTDAEVANINSSLGHRTVTDQKFTDSINTRQNNAVDLNNEINTLYNQDFFVADTTGRRLSQVVDKSNYSSLLPNGNAALQLRLPDLLIYLKTDTYLVDVKTGHHYAVYHNCIEKCLSYRSYIQHGHIDNYSRQTTMMLCVLASIHLNLPPANSLRQLRSLRRPSTVMYRLLKNNSLHRACRQLLTTNLQASTFKFPRGCSRDQNGTKFCKII